MCIMCVYVCVTDKQSLMYLLTAKQRVTSIRMFLAISLHPNYCQCTCVLNYTCRQRNFVNP